jgi:glycosyltransferase involved in cell wall biosynthesis
MRSFEPDVVNVHFPDAQIPFVLWLRGRFDFRLVVSLHGHEVERWFGAGAEMTEGANPRKRMLMKPSTVCRLRSILQEADAITACSQYLLDRATILESKVRQKGHVIRNGVDLERFLHTTPYPHDRAYLLATGRLTYKKGFDILLEAFSRVMYAHPAVDLIIAGDGEEQERLRKQTEHLGLDGRVLFFGRATPEDVAHLLSSCLFVVVPSREEAFGIAALEGMAAGKAILATRVGGLQEFLNPSTNQLRDATVEDLAAGLDELLSRGSDLQEIGKQNREQANAYCWSRVTEQYMQICSGP